MNKKKGMTMSKMTKDFVRDFENGINIPSEVFEDSCTQKFLLPLFQKKMNTGAFDQILFCVHSFLEEVFTFTKKGGAFGCSDQIHPNTLSVSEYTRAHILGLCCYLT